MKILILLTLLSCLAAAGCTGKRQQSPISGGRQDNLVDTGCTGKRQQSPARETTGTDAGKEKLSALLDEMRARLAATTDTALYINAFGNGREGDSIRVALLRNTPEWQKRFRQHVMDSPVLVFDGPDGQEPCPLEGTALVQDLPTAGDVRLPGKLQCVHGIRSFQKAGGVSRKHPLRLIPY